MNRELLRETLRRNNIPDHYYNIDEKGETDQRVCMKKVGDRWKVYYTERGRESQVEFFDTEPEACRCVLDEFYIEDQTVL